MFDHLRKFNIKLILLASITAFAVALCASSSMTKARGAIIEFALVSMLPDANFLDYRGVAQLIARQFRVLVSAGHTT